MRRAYIALLIGPALAVSACSARTTGASNINDGAATLHAVATCDTGQSCTWYWQFWQQGRPRADYQATQFYGPVQGPTRPQAISVRVTDLVPNTTYLWVFCASPNGGETYACAGPHGTFGSTTADPPPDYSTFTTTQPGTLAERLNAKGWRIQATANPAGALRSSLSGVSCNLGRVCTAVGGYFDTQGFQSTLAERWAGTTWTIQPTPNPAGSGGSVLNAISCNSSTACTAVGQYADNGVYVPLAERWDGSAWTIQTTPVPGGSFSNNLSSVSCPSATRCIAVGSDNPPRVTDPLAEGWDGSSWLIQTAPLPGDASGGGLTGVSCSTVTACTAVGSYDNAQGVTQPLVERWDGTSWTIQPASSPAGSVFNAVSCPSATWCTAVGSYNGTSLLAERWDGTSWTIQSIPTPVTSKYGSELTSVSCATATDCTAVEHDLGNSSTWAQHWDGTSWTVQALPNTGGGDSVSSVSCPSLRDCTAVGSQ
jgi:hypothetical protein